MIDLIKNLPKQQANMLYIIIIIISLITGFLSSMYTVNANNDRLEKLENDCKVTEEKVINSQISFARLEEKVDHIRTDIQEIKEAVKDGN